MPRNLLSALFACAAIAAAMPAAAAAAPAPATYNGISADGSVAVFSTSEQMVPGDTDQERDVYVRTYDSGQGEYVTRQVSLGPSGGNDTLAAQYDGISADGSEVFFSTSESMVPADTDHSEDVYVRNIAENRTLLVSAPDPTCPACGGGEAKATFVTAGVPPAGGSAFFQTDEKLSAADQDGAADIYVRDIEAQATTLVSAGDSSCAGSGCGNGGGTASFRGTDSAGGKAFFATSESLSTADTDGKFDFYERDIAGGQTNLISVAGTCPSPLPTEATCDPGLGSPSADGSHFFFETYDRISDADTDTAQDVYDWSGGTPVLASTGPSGGNGEANATLPTGGTAADGSAVYFLTDEQLDSTADSDEKQDVYRRSGGATTLVSAGESGFGNEDKAASFNRAAGSGGSETAIFSTREKLTAADTDSFQDVYARTGGATVLVSTGPEGGNGEFDALFAGVSGDGSKVFFTTSEPLVAQDTDTKSDIYRWSAEGTHLVSAGQINGNGPYAATLHGVSGDGSSAFFATEERLTEGDGDAEKDIYGWNGSSTRLISATNAGFLSLEPPPPVLEGTNPVSPAASTTPAIFGQTEAGALVKIYKSAGCSGEIVAQGTAAELASPGISVSVAAGSTTFFRATAEVDGIVSGCSSSISYKQEEAQPPSEEETEPGPEEGGSDGGGGGTAGTTNTSSTTGTSATGGGPIVRNGVTYVAPLTRVTFGPSSKTRQRRVAFRFLDRTGQPGTRFFCRIDKQRWHGCKSPFKSKKLGFGRHLFRLKAVNAVGTPSAHLVKRRFKVVRRR